MDKIRILTVLAAHTSMSLTDALALAHALNAEFSKPRQAKIDLSTFDGRVAFAKSQPEVMKHLPDRKIQAIKELRQAMTAQPGGFAYSGLRECKDAIDVLAPPRPYF